MTRTGRASFAQERFYFLNRIQPGNPAYVIAFALRIEGPLDQQALADALRRVVAKHDTLRTSFAVVDGELTQQISELAAPEITVLEREPADQDTQDLHLRDLVATEARRPFSLDSGPVLRAWITSWDVDQHALVVLVHHVACDGWAVGLLLDDVAEEYNTGTSRPAGMSYLAYAEAQRSVWSKNTQRLDHWREALAGAQQLALPTDHPRPSVLSYQGAVLRQPVDPELVQQLAKWAKSHGVTVFAVALAAYAQVLSLYARQQDVVIGVPVANRLDEAEEKLFGCLVNTLPMRVDLSGRPTFTELVTRTWRTALAALGDQDVPFEQIVQAVGEQRQLSHAPLFQTSLTVQNFTFTVPEFSGLKVTEVEVEIDASKFDVAMTLDISTASPFLRAEFSTELFDEASIAGLLTHYHTLLRSIVADPATEPTMVDEAEHRLLTQEWNPPIPERPADHPSVLRAFREHATQSPNAVALRHRGHQLTYRQVDQWSSRIASALVDAGTVRGSRIGLLLGRSPAMIAAIIGVWKAGGVYVPLDPEYPKLRLDQIVDSAQPDLVIAEPDTAELAGRLTAGHDIPVHQAQSMEGASVVRESVPDQDDLAYIFYTSGSTGVPKGVMVRHRGLNALCDPRPAGLDIDQSDRWLGVHSFSFDVSIWEIWGALSSGGRLTIADHADLLDPQRLAQLVHSEEITVLSLTPGVLYRVLTPFFDSLQREVSPVRYVVLCGEALSWPQTAALVRPERLTASFVNIYGVTEATIYNTIVQVPAAELHQVKDGDIGVPLPSNRCYVLDERQRPTGVNVPGELYLGGEGVAAGYVGRPDLTAARFGPDPYSPGALYRTGDIAKWSPDGTLIYFGREDTQVKVRGHRVELGDVETVFLRQPGVRACVVAVEADELVAFLCVGPDTVGERELRERVRQELPGFMVPSHLVVVPDIPLNPSGKVDTRRLLAENRSIVATSATTSDADPPGDSLSTRIRAIWAEVLRKPDIEPGDNFFDLGGNSFALITVQQRMAAAGLDISVTDLFRFSTVAACAAHFRRAEPTPVEDRDGQRRRARDQFTRRRRNRRGAGHV